MLSKIGLVFAALLLLASHTTAQADPLVAVDVVGGDAHGLVASTETQLTPGRVGGLRGLSCEDDSVAMSSIDGGGVALEGFSMMDLVGFELVACQMETKCQYTQYCSTKRINGKLSTKCWGVQTCKRECKGS